MTSGLLVAVGYLLGSVPFALLLAGASVRRAGSGNLGAANVLRVSRTSVALGVLALDVSKGSLAVLLARPGGGDGTLALTAGLAAVVGHIYPVWLRFRGGKGVATTFGVFVVIAPAAAAVSAALFGLAVWTTRYVSVGSILGLVSLPWLVYVVDGGAEAAAGAAGIGVLVLFRHRGNLARLWSGDERRLEYRGWSGRASGTRSTGK